MTIYLVVAAWMALILHAVIRHIAREIDAVREDLDNKENGPARDAGWDL